MAIDAVVLFRSAQEVHETHPWGKAYTYSITGHATFFLLVALLAWNAHRDVKYVLREINFIEKPAPAAPARQVTVQDEQGGSRKGIATEPTKGAVNRNSQSVRMASPRGKPDGRVVSPKPLAGPIIALGQIGAVGKKKGRIVELQGNARSRPSSKALILPADANGTDEAISLDTENMGDIKKKESSLGVPLVSQNVVSGALGGRARQLAQGLPGQRKKASPEYLKANPLDKDKWGKSKGPFSMEGPLKYRKILKMELPPYPRWAEEKGLEASVSIRLWVNPKGKVLENFYLEKTTGYSELDHLAMEALQRFEFVPIPDDQPQEDEWGVATFRFELRK